MKKRNILMSLLLSSAQWMIAQESLSLAGT